MDSRKRALMIIFVTVFIDLLGFGIVLPLLPRYGERLGATATTLGLLMASFSAMQFIFTPIWGRVSDRIGRRPILLLGLAGSVIFYALFGVASTMESLVLMFVARIGAGISGATIATAQAFIADSTPPERRSKGMALIGAAFGIGFTFGPLLGSLALFLDTGDLALAAPAEVAIATGPAAAGALSPMPGYLASAVSAVAFLLAIAMLPESLSADSRTPRHDWFDLANFRLALSAPAVASLINVFFIATVAFAMFESTLSLVSSSVFGLGDSQNFYLFAFIGFSLMFAQGVVVRRMSGKVSDERMARIGLATLIAGLIGVALGPRVGSLTFFAIMIVVMVHGFAFMTTSLQSLISRRSRADQQGGILGVNQAGSALARIVGPFAGIKLFGDYGANFPYIVSVVILLVAGGFLFAATRLESSAKAA